jgi:hypothetical protein
MNGTMTTSETRNLSRRRFLAYAATAPFLLRYHELAAADKKKVRIRDVQVMVLQGDRTYVLLGIELNPDVAKAHLAPGESWWG